MTAVSSISMRVHGDRLDGVLNHEWSIDAPSLDDLDGAIERLDGSTYTTLIIAAGGQEHLAIGGGAGTGVVLATKGKEMRLAPGADVTSRLTAPVTVRLRVS